MMIEFGDSGWLLLQLVISVILPLIVGFVTKKSWSSRVKSIILFMLAVETSLLTSIASALDLGVKFNFSYWLFELLTSLVVSVSAHGGFYKPSGVTAWVQDRLVYDPPVGKHLSS